MKYSFTLISVLVLLISLLHLSGLVIFTRGFLLNRVTLNDISDFKSLSHKSHSKAIILVVDALRFDFLFNNDENGIEFNENFHNVLNLPSKLTNENPDHSLIFHSYADPPTTTLQRIKGITTGSLPTFIDIGNAFSGQSIEEDNLIHQCSSNNLSTAFVGDDTWLNVYPSHFNISIPYDSFNVEDLHSVDEGVNRHLFDLMKSDVNLIIGHFLGVDHVGHRVGPSHSTMFNKLTYINSILNKVVDALDDDTLLVVLGDHGMDDKGDHGGDSDLETSTGLWIYSKFKPITNKFIKSFTNVNSNYYDGKLGKFRSIQQIDLLPTLSLLLGLPIPFNNLGSIIPEVFPNSSSLKLAQLVNANQIYNYLKTYSLSQSGYEIKPFLNSLNDLYDFAISTVTNDDSIPNKSNQYDFDKSSFDMFNEFFSQTLFKCRSIWAQFHPSFMILGIIVLSLTIPILIGIFNITNDKNDLNWLINLFKKLKYSSPLVFLSLSMKLFIHNHFFEYFVFISSIIIEITLITSIRKDILKNFKSLLKSSIGLLLHCSIFLSNSYILWEDRVLLILLQTFTILNVKNIFKKVIQNKLKYKMIGYSILIGICLRLISSSTVCREELGGWCFVTFYASSSSSIPPLLVILTIIPFALTLPTFIKYILNITKSYSGFSPIMISKWFRFSLCLSSSYWLLDLLDTQYNNNFTHFFKTYLGRFNFILIIVIGFTFWYYSPLCIDIKENQTDNNKKVFILGFANSYGSYYLLFTLPFFSLIYFTNQLSGQIVFGLCLIVIISYLELMDHENDNKLLKKLLKNKNNKSKITNTIIRPSLKSTVFLSQLAYLIYFTTGHQAVLSTLQWKSAFIGFPKLTYPVAPLLVTLNTIGPFFLIGLIIPLLSFWKISPRPNSSLPLSTNTLRSCCGFMTYNTLITITSSIAAAYFRRHLMVWKVSYGLIL